MTFAARRWRQPEARYLSCATEVRVRFSEVDSLRVVWHGHYLTYFEEGRQAFGRKFGLRYEDVLSHGVRRSPGPHLGRLLCPGPVRQLLTVTARLHPEPAARLTFTFQVANARGDRLATGRSVQAFTDLEGALVLTRPAFYEAFLARWDDVLEGP